jgi:hypothetical protein
MLNMLKKTSKSETDWSIHIANFLIEVVSSFANFSKVNTNLFKKIVNRPSKFVRSLHFNSVSSLKPAYEK